MNLDIHLVVSTHRFRNSIKQTASPDKTFKTFKRFFYFVEVCSSLKRSVESPVTLETTTQIGRASCRERV